MERDYYLVIGRIGETYFIKILVLGNDLLDRVRARVKNSGITRESLDELTEEESGAVWGKRQSLS